MAKLFRNGDLAADRELLPVSMLGIGFREMIGGVLASGEKVRRQRQSERHRTILEQVRSDPGRKQSAKA